jgi:carbon storage regulator
MLVLSRKVGESVIIGGGIVVTVVRVDGEAVRLGIAAPQTVPVHRQEVYEEIQRNNREALTQQRRQVPKLPPRKERAAATASAGAWPGAAGETRDIPLNNKP